jgi:arylsulfatase A-like enzyme
VKQKPHILLITTDQQRHDATGATGPGFLRTPHFQQLCSQGVRFDRAYADCPLCVPSRVTIMTGQPAYQHGCSTNGQTRAFIDRESSLPAVIAAQGYQTAAIGKMHFGPQRLRHGFQEMILPDDYYREMGKSGEPLQPMRHGLGQNEIYPGMSTVPEARTLTSWIAEQSVDYIRYRRDPELPFFLWCSFSKPHPPFDPPEPYYSMYLNDNIPEPVISDWCRSEDCPVAFRRFMERRGMDIISPEIIRAARAAYYGLITQIDYNMGRILGALQESGILKDTLILYASDHGEYLGDHQTCAKSFFHDPSARVPFVLRLPQGDGDAPVNQVDDRLVTLADIYPTLVRAAGGEVPASVPGRDLQAVLNGEAAPRESIVGLQGSRDAPESMAVIEKRWKYIYYPEGPAEQLFDLETDPNETKSLSPKNSAHSETFARMRKILVGELKANGRSYLEHGHLPVITPGNDSLDFRRSHDFPGFSTEYKDVDTRH